MKIKKRYIAGAVVVVLILVIGFAIFNSRPKAKETTLTENVKKGDIAVTVSASGKVVSRVSQSVSAKTNAKVVNVLVSTGDQIKAGQVMAYLDSFDLQNAYKNAQYALASAIYNRDKVKSVPGADSNSIKAAQQQVNQAQVALDTAKRNLDNDKILAPFDGEVTAVNIHVNDTASPTQPAFVMQTANDLEGVLNVNEIDVVKVKLEQIVEADIDAVSDVRKAKIYSIVNTADVTTGVVTYLTKIRFEDTKNLRPGMTVNADIQIESKKDVLLVPSAALKERNGKTYVDVVTGTDNSGKKTTQEKEVTVGLNNNADAEVTSGLKEGDTVVINIQDGGSTTSLFGNN